MPVAISEQRAIPSRLRGLVQRLLKFGFAGVVAGGLAFVTSLVLYHFAGTSYLISQACGFVVGVLVNYPLNRKWTFANRYSNIIVQFGAFVAVSLAGFGVNELTLYELAGVHHLWVPASMACALMVAFVFNFALHSALTFGRLS